MEIVFVLGVTVVFSIAIIVLLLVVAGISSVFGASFHTVFVYGLWALLIPPLFILFGWLFGRNSVSVHNVVINSSSLPEAFDGYRIVQISDLHLRSFKDRPERLAEIIDRVNSEKPDLIVFTGDLVTVHPDEILPFESELRRLSAPDGIYSVMGNHDYCPYNRWESEKEMDEAIAEVRRRELGLGWRLLDNSHVDISRPSSGTDSLTFPAKQASENVISIIGVENISASPHFESHGDLDKAMEGVEGSFRILLSHDPTHWKAGVLGKKKIDLTLSGHTHNAQFRLFGIEPSRLVFKENSGLYTSSTALGTQRLYVNDGIGTTLFPARIGVPSEITVFTLEKDSDGSVSISENESLCREIAAIADSVDAETGVAAIFENGNIVLFDNKPLPLLSVVKFHQALAVCDWLRRDGISLDAEVKVTPDMLPADTWSPLRDEFPDGGNFSWRELLTYTLQVSDNNACDILFALTSGPEETAGYINSLGISGLGIECTEAEMHENLDNCYRNWSTPLSAVQLLEAFWNSRDTDEYSEFVWQTMSSCNTGLARIPAGIPTDEATVVHKTGTGDTGADGRIIAVNDIGIVYLPDGSHFSVAVFISDADCTLSQCEKTISSIVRAVYEAAMPSRPQAIQFN